MYQAVTTDHHHPVFDGIENEIGLNIFLLQAVFARCPMPF
jgi:hypothetical protein